MTNETKTATVEVKFLIMTDPAFTAIAKAEAAVNGQAVEAIRDRLSMNDIWEAIENLTADNAGKSWIDDGDLSCTDCGHYFVVKVDGSIAAATVAALGDLNLI